MTDVHHCPRCELIFTNVAELRDHLEHDHHANDVGMFEKFHYPSRRPEKPRPACLVLANQTLADLALHDEIERRARNGSRILLVVPTTHAAHLVNAPHESAVDLRDDAEEDVGAATARWRMRNAVATLARRGVEVEARMGDPDPMVAVAEVIARDDVEEILISTLAPGLSRWLGADLVTRIERRFHRPVHAITPSSLPS